MLIKFPAGILPKLCNLYSLRLNWGSETSRETVQEAARSSDRLDTFVGYFSKLDDFNTYVKSSDGQRSKKFHFQVSTVYNGSVANARFYSFLRIGDVNKSVCFYRCKICEREDVTIVLPKDVRGLIMRDIEDVTSLNDVLSKEQGLVNAGKFSHLKALWFSYCPNLQKLFSLQLLPALQNLEFLVVRSCKRIEEIVEVNDEETQKELGTSAITVTLPRLKKLWLSFLPELKSVCSDNAVLICILSKKFR